MRKYPKRSLAVMVRKLRPNMWTAHPLESYRNDELVTLILEAEFPHTCPWHEQPKDSNDGKCEQCRNPHKGDPYLDPALRHESTRYGRTVFSSHADGPYADRCANCPPCCDDGRYRPCPEHDPDGYAEWAAEGMATAADPDPDYGRDLDNE